MGGEGGGGPIHGDGRWFHLDGGHTVQYTDLVHIALEVGKRGRGTYTEHINKFMKVNQILFGHHFNRHKISRIKKRGV